MGGGGDGRVDVDSIEQKRFNLKMDRCHFLCNLCPFLKKLRKMRNLNL